MKSVVYVTGVSTLCLAGWMAVVAWGCDKAGQALIHLGSNE